MKLFGALARRQTQTCVLMGLLVLGIRGALLPIWPIPQPIVYDEFSYLLQADTFAQGRLTNPPHPLWQFFESIYILQQPTYASKYPPGQSLALAAGQRLFGDPWYGVWLSCGALAAALCWALQAWVGPRWALLGAIISLDLCLFSYWMNSYWGGAVAGIGGALVIGAWARVARAGKTRFAWVFGVGVVILSLTRPFEGLLLAIPAAVALWLRAKQRRMQIWIPIAITALAGAAWHGFYDYRVTGHALRMPYQEYFSQYESIPPLNILPVQPEKVYRHFNLEFHNSGWTRQANRSARSWQLPAMRLHDLYETLKTLFGGPAWILVLLVSCPSLMLSRRSLVPIVLASVMAGGAMIELIYYSHYAAPFAAVLLILLIESVRQLRLWVARHFSGARRSGRVAVIVLVVGILGVSWARHAKEIYDHNTPEEIRAVLGSRPLIEKDLLQRSGRRHVIFVRYTGTQMPHQEWIYNPADIDASPVIWAQDMGSQNEKLMSYYAGRSFWLFDPDRDTRKVQPWSQP